MKKFLKEAAFLLTSPLVLAGCYALVFKLSNNFWYQLFTIIGVTAVLLMNANTQKQWREGLGRSVMVLRNLIIVATGSLLTSILANLDNHNQNYSGLLLWMFSFIGIGVVITSMYKNNAFDQFWELNKNYQRGVINKILATCFIVAQIAELYVHLGSQYIWVPVINLVVFISLFFQESTLHNWFNKKKLNDVAILIACWVGLVFIAILSSLYQFIDQISGGFFKAIEGIALFLCAIWDILCEICEVIYTYGIIAYPKISAGVGAIVVALIIVKIVKRMLKKRAKKIEEQEQLRKNAEKQEAEKAKKKEELEKKMKVEEEYQKKIDALIEKIKSYSKNEFKWFEILKVSNHCGHTCYGLMRVRAYLAPLSQLIEISEIRKQIVFPSDFRKALELINKLCEDCYDDRILNEFINQLVDLLRLVYEFKNFKGYEDLIKEIRNNCPIIYKLIPRETLEDLLPMAIKV